MNKIDLGSLLLSIVIAFLGLYNLMENYLIQEEMFSVYINLITTFYLFKNIMLTSERNGICMYMVYVSLNDKTTS